ncbi:sugar ABC transporter ATP-binding protein [Thermogemmatispora sp.]|uniref:sugar ABC transporter ATP-binding protein n=1 Tax=Thermogemmatispora sp. TaxID=1968838 RepID=UPI0035E44387
MMEHPAAAPASRATGVPRLQVRRVSKTFPGVQALKQVSLEVWPGEIHALVGENGAGKSTLMRLIAGVETPDEGEILLDGRPLGHIDEDQAGRLGISMVHQERSLVPGLSIAENVFAARQPTRWLGTIDWARMRQRTRQILRELAVDLPPDRLVGELSPAQQQMIEIAKGLSRQLRLLILDEPTAALTLAETEHLFEVVRHLAASGVSVIYISHRLAEVFRIAERITVLKDGSVTGVRAVNEVDEAELVRLMVGRELSFEPDQRRVSEAAPVVLQVEEVAAPPAVRQASLTVRAGEIVCLAGLVGAGRSELCEVIFGARPRSAGRILLAGREVHFRHPSQAREAGIGMVPEDRKEDGLFLDMSLSDNLAAANLSALAPHGLLSRRRARRLAETYIRDLRIVTPHADQLVLNLSGGNQQKVLLARWFARQPRLLIIDEPTRGVDVGARADIYRVLRDFAASGMALLVVSSDLPEVLTLAHRIVIMSEGKTVAELDAAEADEQTILALASPGAHKSEESAS